MFRVLHVVRERMPGQRGQIPGYRHRGTGVRIRGYARQQPGTSNFAYILKGIDKDLIDDAASGDTKLHFGIVYRY